MNANGSQTIENVPEGSVGDVAQGLVDAGYTTITATREAGKTTWILVGRQG